MTAAPAAAESASAPPLRLDFEPSGHNGWVVVSGGLLGEVSLRIWYIELYQLSDGQANYDADHVVAHTTRQVGAAQDGSQLELRCELADGVIVEHTIRVDGSAVDFRLQATNTSAEASDVQFGACCVNVGPFTGCAGTGMAAFDPDTVFPPYLAKSFVFVDGELTRMPTEPWARPVPGAQGRAEGYPGQVWPAPRVCACDCEAHPLSEVALSNGLIGCFSSDEKVVMATAWEPYQCLFQGIISCLHADPRIGGLEPGETKHARGKLYLAEARDVGALARTYEADFPEHAQGAAGAAAAL